MLRIRIDDLKLFRRCLIGVILAAGGCVILRTINFAVLRSQLPGEIKSHEAALSVEREVGYKPGQPIIVEFLDFQCSPCRQLWPSAKDFRRIHPEIRWVLVNYPLPVHPDAFAAAVCFSIARRFGQGEAMAEHLMSDKVSLSTSSLNTDLARMGLKRLVGLPQAATFESQVLREVRLAKAIGVRGTPSLFVLSKTGVLTEIHSLDAAELFLK